MSSARPLRQSARQSAIRQQEYEAEQEALRQKAIREEARREKEKQEAALREELARQEKLLQEQQRQEQEQQRQEQEDRSSSRSLSPALSGSLSLSSDDDDLSEAEEDDEEEEDDEDDSNDSQTNGAAGESEERPTDGSDLRSNSAVALVYGFLTKFRPLLRQICPLHEFSIEDIESGLTATESNSCIEEIHANLLSNMLNRKKAVDATTWQKVLSETLDGKLRTGELEYDGNPLRFYGNYYSVPTPDRAQILKALVDWVLQEGMIIRDGIEQNKEISRVVPFGSDQAKRTYWHFGDGTMMMYRETKGAKRKAPGWETVASNLDELKSLVTSFEKSTSKAEKAMREKMRVEIIEPEEERLVNEKLKQERLEKKLLRIAELHQLAATRTTRTRSSNRLNAPKYTFDDDEDEFEEDEYAIYRRPSSRRRFNQDAAADSITEGVSPGHQQPQPQQSQEQQHSMEQSNGHTHALAHDASASVDSTSRRSSMGHESDSSIRAALQRTRVADGGVDSVSGSVEREDQDDDYQFEEDQDDDEPSAHTTLATAPAVPAPSSSPVAPVVSEQKNADPSPVATAAATATAAPVSHLTNDLAPAPSTVASNVDQDVDMN